ncbi:outer membrane lipoprotein chaperone LolA [Pseudoalteromonas denitrificans]|uniref:Outer-membrane lipoprotein carrier protein n=1 Tax=Pseudoalteromonas denitrificans DSM 6059 TaxID=1123010 RepID=A0A1I1SPZ4_9GAMM|nr:outer membrane lipoprotein chaperone LolA [Pseudoalteromonas denitrificans]SFD46798.1 outer membrane lipoprotein carrier protein [Pseudoalteromonas denitrificans DSM 6059]
MIKKSILGLMFSMSFSTLAGDLEQLRSQLNLLTSFTASFEQVVKDEQGEILQKGKGNIALQQPNKINWQQTEPDETLLVSNGVKTYYFDSFAEQVSIFNSNKLIQSTPFILLTSNDEKLWQKYTVTLANNAYTVTPKSLDNAQVSALVIYFKNDKGLEKLEIKDVSGQTSYFDFSNSKVNQKIDDDTFKFVIPAGVEIDDQTSN